MKNLISHSVENTASSISPRDDDLDSTHHRIHLNNILVPLDLSEMSLKALRYAVPFAEQFGGKITLLHVLKPPVCTSDFPYPGPGGLDHLDVMQRRLEGIRKTEIPSEVPVDVIVRQGFAFENIIQVARELRADLIIASTHGYTGLSRALNGSTAENIVRRAPCPVLVVRELETDFV